MLEKLSEPNAPISVTHVTSVNRWACNKTAMASAAPIFSDQLDQWRGDWADPAAPVLSLPALQSLAREGWSARRCYTSSPQCPHG